MAIQSRTANFTGAEPLDGELPFIDITWPTAYAAPEAYRIAHGVTINDGGGPVVVNVKNKTSTGVRVIASGQFVGTVEVTAY